MQDIEDSNEGCILCGKCCYLKYVPDKERLNEIEVRRIENITGMSREEFTEILPARYDSYPFLKYVPDKNGDHHCIFLLHSDDGTRPCSLFDGKHDYRPSYCRMYPHDSDTCLENRIIHSSSRTRSLRIIVRQVTNTIYAFVFG